MVKQTQSKEKKKKIANPTDGKANPWILKKKKKKKTQYASIDSSNGKAKTEVRNLT